MTGQGQNSEDMNLLFPSVSKPSDGSANQQGADNQGKPQQGSAAPMPDQPDFSAGDNPAEKIDSPESISAGSASVKVAEQPADGHGQEFPGDVVDTNWDIPLITFPSSDSPALLGGLAAENANGDAKKQHSPRMSVSTSGASLTGATGTSANSKTDLWLKEAAADRDIHKNVDSASNTDTGTSVWNVPATKAADEPLLSPPSPDVPMSGDIPAPPVANHTANAETETMTPVSTAAVVAGTNAIKASVDAPGAVKTNATRKLHVQDTFPKAQQDAVGELSSELSSELSDKATSNAPDWIPEDTSSDGNKSWDAKRLRSRAIVVVFVVITVVAAAVGLYYLGGMIRTNRNRSRAYSNCTYAYSNYKEESETLKSSLKKTKKQQTVGTDQVADVMTVEKLKTAVKNANAIGKPVVCSTMLSTDALNQAATTNEKLASDTKKANTSLLAAAKAVTASVKTKTSDDYQSALTTLKTTTSEASTLLTNSQGVVADDTTRQTLQSAIDASNALLAKDKPDIADIQKAQNDLQSASDAVNKSMEAYKNQQPDAQSSTSDSTGSTATNNSGASSSNSGNRGTASSQGNSSQNSNGNGSQSNSQSNSHTTTPSTPATPAPQPSAPDTPSDDSSNSDSSGTYSSTQ